MICWSLCSSFHFVWKAEMIFPYASRGVLYAARVRTGVSGVWHSGPPAELPLDAPLLPPQAAPTNASALTTPITLLDSFAVTVFLLSINLIART